MFTYINVFNIFLNCFMWLISGIVLKKTCVKHLENAHAKYGGDCFSNSKILEKNRTPLSNL